MLICRITENSDWLNKMAMLRIKPINYIFDEYLGYNPPAYTSNWNCQQIFIDMPVVSKTKIRKNALIKVKGHKNKKKAQKKETLCKYRMSLERHFINAQFVVHFYFIFIEKFRVKRHSKTQNGNDGYSFIILCACNGANWILRPKNKTTLTNDFKFIGMKNGKIKSERQREEERI